MKKKVVAVLDDDLTISNRLRGYFRHRISKTNKIEFQSVSPDVTLVEIFDKTRKIRPDVLVVECNFIFWEKKVFEVIKTLKKQDVIQIILFVTYQSKLAKQIEKMGIPVFCKNKPAKPIVEKIAQAIQVLNFRTVLCIDTDLNEKTIEYMKNFAPNIEFIWLKTFNQLHDSEIYYADLIIATDLAIIDCNLPGLMMWEMNRISKFIPVLIYTYGTEFFIEGPFNKNVTILPIPLGSDSDKLHDMLQQINGILKI